MPWARHTAIQPTPLVLANEGIIRIYVGCRDDNGVSRIGYVDLDGDNPSRVLHIAQEPVLDVGLPGTFDDNGVVPCAVVPRDGRIFMYYAGYQLPPNVKFCVFGGLAVSDDGGRTFSRVQRVPVLDRTDDELYFRVAHSVLREGNRWRVWYGGGSEWVRSGHNILPVYDVRYIESDDGIIFPPHGEVHVTFSNHDEYRIGRPFVFVYNGMYRMFYGSATKVSGYRLGYAESPDGYIWTRKDDEIGITVTEASWDSTMIAYPSVVRSQVSVYMFYNGNNMGRDGFGYALLEHW
jgi:hypothetical protein